jgi:DNA-binding NarL/FixJ family response regulator
MQTIKVRVEPALKLAPTRQAQSRDVVLAAPVVGGQIAGALHGLRTHVVSGGADAAFRAVANSSRRVAVIVVDADEVGVQTIRDLHTIFPDVRILALSKDASVRASAVPAGATVALPTSTPTAQLAKMVSRLAS